MRRNIKPLFFILLCLTGTRAAYAYDIAVDNADGITIYYNFINNETELEVTSYKRMKRTEKVGNFVISYKYYNRDGTEKEVTEESTRPPYTGDVVIPEYVTITDKTFKVTSIGQGAFLDCPSLSGVSIPNSVTHICKGAFSFSGLKHIRIPENVISIESDAFDRCSRLCSIIVDDGNRAYDSRNNCNAIIETNSGRLIVGCNSTVIPKGVTAIGDNAFSGCEGLTSIEIPNSVTSIGRFAFSGCNDLISISIPNSVDSISRYCFSRCARLVSVDLPDKLISIGASAFSNCPALDSVVIPKGVKSIEDGTFIGCRSLSSVVIPKNVTVIGECAFARCSSLTSINIPPGVESIRMGAFSGCRRLKEVMIPKSVTSIGMIAFQDCSLLASIVIPEGVMSIEERAFERCTSLVSLTIPNSVTTIGDGAFQGCFKMSTVTIGNGVKSIGKVAFDSKNLSTIVSLIKNPLAIGGIETISWPFSANAAKEAVLLVPAGTQEKYQKTDGWKDFLNIKESR